MRIAPSSPGLALPRVLLDPPKYNGALFQQNPDGKVEILKLSGQTSPEGPPDIGGDAAPNNEVFISVNGIDQDWEEHHQQIKNWWHGGFPNGADLGQPIVGIHEGNRSGLSDQVRVFKNTLLLKKLQAGWSSAEKIQKAAYKNDPSIKTIHDQLRQNLAVGRKLTLMAHSGGGSQVALAMSILAKEDDGLWAEAIGKNVRVLGTAATATRDDFRQAGVEDQNIFLTYSLRDPVPSFYRTPTSLRKPWTIAQAAARGLAVSVRTGFQAGPYHEGQYIFDKNMTPRGNRITKFVEGGPGGTYQLP